MIRFNKNAGFTLSEILVTIGLIGAISAMTIPTLAYNYRAKVLEEQFRSTYSEVREIGSRLNYDKGDVGTYANKSDFISWQKEFMSMINGGNNLLDGLSPGNITDEMRKIYKNAGGSPGPYRFNLGATGRVQTSVICDNGSIWLDSKGRIWTFNDENRIICVDINGIANPNRINIDIFAYIPMSAEQIATWVYEDPDNPDNYSGSIIPCDLDVIIGKGLSNAIPEKPYVKNTVNKKVALDACPFFEPIENIAPMNSSSPGRSAKNRPVTSSDTYWKTYINYK